MEDKVKIKKGVNFIWDNLIAGIIAILPAAATVLIVRFLVTTLNGIMLNPLVSLFAPALLEEKMRLFIAKVIIFLIAIALIVIFGFLMRQIIVRRTLIRLERFLFKLPIVNKIYRASKEVRDALVNLDKAAYKNAVLIEFPRKGVYSVGFVTFIEPVIFQKALGSSNIANVYVPTVPNPTTGYLIVCEKSELIPLDVSIEEAFKMIITAGAIMPDGSMSK